MSKIFILSYGDLNGVDGAAIRLKTFAAYVRKLHPNCEIITICSIREKLTQYTVKVYYDNDLVYEKSSKDYSIFFRTIIKRSLNLARVRGFNEILTIEKAPQIYVHTLRVFGSLAPELRQLVKHIDVCDNNIRSFRQAAKSYLILRRFHLGLLLLNEARVEQNLLRLALSQNIRLSFITQDDLACDRNSMLLPNIYKPEYCGNASEFPKAPYTYGIIGNFRTLANKSIIENFIKSDLNVVGSSVKLFGLNAEGLSGERVSVHGAYNTNLEIIKKFDIGLCLVTLRGGIQNKVIDYLSMGKVALVSNEVYEAFRKDPNFELLSHSPFLIRIGDAHQKMSQVFTIENYQINEHLYKEYLND
ncbi:hypothetical protein N9M64_00125 [bacterium]|nr:hypothetical protein [bacterium]